ncbi:MAG: helical backbone metal receptor [Gemmataceae bacterium]
MISQFSRIVFVFMLFTGCQSRSVNPVVSGEARTFSDDLNRSVTLQPAAMKRVITLTPALTETVYALGYGDRVVGVSGWSNYPEAATTKPAVGGPDEKQLNHERIVELKPDLILADGGFQKGAIESLSKLGFTVYAFEVDRISGVEAMMKRITEMLGETETSQTAIEAFHSEDQKRQTGRYREQPRVFYLFGDPLFTAGGTSFSNELIERAGGINLFRNVDKKSFQASEEELIRRNPDVIVLPRGKDPDKQIADILARETWKTLNAVKNRNIVLLDEDQSSRPAPRILDAVRELETALHPPAKAP